MTEQEINKILEERLDFTKATLAKKAEEYAIGDRLYNFKRAAEFERETPQKALLGMMAKHIVSVLDLLEGKLTPTEYLINEKFGDAINYLILGEAILKEQLAEQTKGKENKKNNKNYAMCIATMPFEGSEEYSKGCVYTYHEDNECMTSKTFVVIDNFSNKHWLGESFFNEYFIPLRGDDVEFLINEGNK